MKNKLKNNLNPEMERQLLSRLWQMGILLIGFCICTFAYGMFLNPPVDDGVDTLEEQEVRLGFTLLSTDQRINAFSSAGVFFLIGSICLLVAARRKSA